MKHVLLLGLLAVAITPLHAQKPQFGFHGGLTASTYQGRHVPEARYLAGGAGGLWLRLPLRPWLDLQPEVVYEQRGSQTSYTFSLSGTFSVIRSERRERTRLHYVSLPVLARLHVGKVYILAGPQISYLLTQRTHARDIESTLQAGSTVSTTHTSTYNFYNLESYNRRQIGYCLGLGYEVTPRLAVEARYTNNWTTVQRPQQLISPNDLNRAGYQARALAWQAQASYRFGRRQ